MPALIRQTLIGELDGLFRFAMARVGHDAHRAEDAVQQTVLIAIGHRAPPGDAGQQRAWVRGILQNVIRRQFRTQRRGRAALHAAADAQTTVTGGDDPSPDEGRAALLETLYLAVTELDQADQDLFYAFYRAGRSHAQIAADLGITCKAVETRLYRLRTRLRRSTERRGKSRS